MTMKKYQLPKFLIGVITQEKYERWLQERSIAHVRRDKRRGNRDAKNAKYKILAFKAVIHDGKTAAEALAATGLTGD